MLSRLVSWLAGAYVVVTDETALDQLDAIGAGHLAIGADPRDPASWSARRPTDDGPDLLTK